VVLMLRESPHGLSGCCVYRSELFDDATIARMLGDFQSVLENLVRHPERPISAIGHSRNERYSS
jgi:non-ribosomal peptide synthetase component F